MKETSEGIDPALKFCKEKSEVYVLVQCLQQKQAVQTQVVVDSILSREKYRTSLNELLRMVSLSIASCVK